MKNYLLLSTIFIFISVVNVFSQEDVDPLDISEQISNVKKYGLPTIEGVNDLGNKATESFANKNWEQAIIDYENYAKQSNYLANLIAQGLEPYYSASYDERKSARGVGELIPFETKANYYKEQRNIAYLKIGISYSRLGKKDDAVPYLIKALDLIAIDNKANWETARNELYSIIGYNE